MQHSDNNGAVAAAAAAAAAVAVHDRDVSTHHVLSLLPAGGVAGRTPLDLVEVYDVSRGAWREDLLPRLQVLAIHGSS